MLKSTDTPGLSLAERALYHQVHPAKLATDFSTAGASLVLLAQHRLGFALVVMWIPSILVSAWLIRSGDFTSTRSSALGVYLRRNMTQAKQAVRFAGMAAAALGAWWGQWWLLPLGVALVAWGWFGAWLLERARR